MEVLDHSDTSVPQYSERVSAHLMCYNETIPASKVSTGTMLPHVNKEDNLSLQANNSVTLYLKVLTLARVFQKIHFQLLKIKFVC